MENNLETLSQIIEEVLCKFNSTGVNYCILRNYESFPESYTGVGDIDILILNDDFEKVRCILEQYHFIRFRGAIPGHVQFVLYVKKARKFILIDLHVNGFSYAGILYLPEKQIQILNRKRGWVTFFIPSKEDMLITLLLHSIIDKGFFKQKYIDSIETLLNNDVDFEHIKDTLGSLFGKRTAPQLVFLLKNRTYNSSIGLRIYLLFQRLFRDPQNILFFTRYIITTRLLKILNPKRGNIIALIGTDGSGKSTVAEKLKQIFLEGDFKASVVYMGWKDNFVLPLFGTMTKIYANVESKKQDEILDNKQHKSHKNEIVSDVISLAKEILCSFEFIARYIVRIYPKKRLGEVVISDRYVYDRVVLNEKIDRGIKFFVLHLFPKPNFIFYLDNDPITLLKRKNEISLDEINQQRVFFEKYEKILGFEKIWTEQDVNGVCDQILAKTWKEIVKSV